jgi:hypothetical protein
MLPPDDDLSCATAIAIARAFAPRKNQAIAPTSNQASAPINHQDTEYVHNTAFFAETSTNSTIRLKKHLRPHRLQPYGFECRCRHRTAAESSSSSKENARRVSRERKTRVIVKEGVKEKGRQYVIFMASPDRYHDSISFGRSTDKTENRTGGLWPIGV